MCISGRLARRRQLATDRNGLVVDRSPSHLQIGEQLDHSCGDWKRSAGASHGHDPLGDCRREAAAVEPQVNPLREKRTLAGGAPKLGFGKIGRPVAGGQVAVFHARAALLAVFQAGPGGIECFRLLALDCLVKFGGGELADFVA
ncbi:hypothetical protein CA13_37170 [Planctomycetes bacterium CA13]|uniref:Uncharacterized protein n=1 Tax=Novipirellula herctigrandis TaxID=2527986 RepID=A0A5C5Z4W8_9BACT|nr:hypothetical protein CA13_37170 [Planctomycetes bacterium CA13]